MYLTTANDGVVALDALTGHVRWRRKALQGSFVQCCGQVNRGAAISDDLLFIGRLDGVLLALQRKTGDVKWATVVANNAAGYSITMAPVVYHGSVIVGVGGSEFGIRGFLTAYALHDGTLKWRWYATDRAHWFGPSVQLRLDRGRVADARTSARLRTQFADAWKRGGGGMWTTPAIDDKRNAIFVATGNPWPDFDGSRRPGDNLFTDCIVAVDGSTGRLRWYFQETPHDVRDLEPASPPILFDTIDNAGRSIAAVGQAGKTGIFYVLDRDSGKLIRRTKSVASFGPSRKNGEVWDGGSSWSPTSFDPHLGYAIVSASQHLRPKSEGAGGAGGSLSARSWSTGYGTVSAVKVATGAIVWQDKFDQGIVGGSVSTAGGITFVGEGNGYFDALDTQSGVRLWRFKAGPGVNAPPIIFAEDGEEYVAVAAGGNQQFGTPYGDALFVFRLNDR